MSAVDAPIPCPHAPLETESVRSVRVPGRGWRRTRGRPTAPEPTNEPTFVRTAWASSPIPVAARVFAPLGSWLILASGLALLAALVLIPARVELEAARAERDRALAIESHSRERIARHEAYLAALDAGDEQLITELAAAHLRLVPEDREVLLRPSGPGVVTLE